MLPAADIAVYVNRIEYGNLCTPDGLTAMASDVARAAALLPATVDVVAFGCTSGTVNIGPEKLTSLISLSHPDARYATPITGAVGAFQTLGAKRIAVVTPYIDSVNETIGGFLEAAGFVVHGMTGFGLERDEDIGALPLSALVEAAESIGGHEADAIFFSCTALVMVEAVDDLERRFGKPVVTSNQAMLREALRTAGYMAPIEGYGRVMTI